MPLLAATSEGVYRAPDDDFDAAHRVLAATADGYYRVRRFDDAPGPGGPDGAVFAAGDGLHRSTDGGERWTDLDVPDAEAVTTALVSPDGSYIYAGTQPPHVFRSAGDGSGWRRLDRFDELPGRDDWWNLGAPDRGLAGARVRTLAAHPGAPARVVAGVEAVGVFASDDDGVTWQRRSRGCHDDVHHLRALGPDSWIAACGRGCYRTDDAGRTWRRLDTAADAFWYTYVRETLVHDGVLYAGAQDRSQARHRDVAGGTILESTDCGETFEPYGHPGDGAAFATAFAVRGGQVLAGTSDGHLLARADDGWTEVGRVPGAVRSLAAV